MPPENLPELRERLTRLEEQHRASEARASGSIAEMGRRLDSHIEETERQLVSVNGAMLAMQTNTETLAKTVNDFILTHNLLEESKKKKKLDVKEWLVIAVGVLGTIGGLVAAAASWKQAFGG